MIFSKQDTFVCILESTCEIKVVIRTKLSKTHHKLFDESWEICEILSSIHQQINDHKGDPKVHWNQW